MVLLKESSGTLKYADAKHADITERPDKRKPSAVLTFSVKML